MAQAQRSRPEQLGKRLVREHDEVAVSSWLRLWRQPVTNLLTWLTLAIALALPGTLIIMLNQVQSLASQLDTSNQISVFLALQASPEEGQALSQQWQTHRDIEKTTFIPATLALEQFSQASGLGDILNSLTDNPLPPTILLQPVSDNPADIQQLVEQLRRAELVDQVMIDQLWLQRMHTLVATSQIATLILSLMLAAGVLLVMGNTIRLQLENRREEILVIKLVGGTDAYLRRPFLYMAIWSGLLSGLLACAIMAAALAALAPPLGELAASFSSDWQLSNLGITEVLLTILGSCLLASGASLLTVQRQMAKIEPK